MHYLIIRVYFSVTVAFCASFLCALVFHVAKAAVH